MCRNDCPLPLPPFCYCTRKLIVIYSPDSSIDLGPIAMDVGTPQPKEGDIRMHLDPYDELERENIRAGVFEVDSDRVGAVGENFLRKVGGINKFVDK